MDDNDKRATDVPTEATESPHAEDADVRQDTAYSPGSETETQQKQDEHVSATVDDDDVDDSKVQVAPGTGGPDDVGEVDVDPGEINLPGFSGR
ncbi:hypothetical protein AB3M83_09215 [Microbacterium sp. 179-B 1A2 NHS]|uniref:hypothetical protein n=1 Tax=Microbacterium sp. 179-B 1A2 NHS TaxID=3142383 RepID=UPI0039A2F7A2